ncbi:hypothetical protein TNCV_808941 [Trichonephila clavipes]|nr:hypothetical protein TNCV_808941 [Trichonephila clavipes]
MISLEQAWCKTAQLFVFIREDKEVGGRMRIRQQFLGHLVLVLVERFVHISQFDSGCGSPVVKVSDQGRHVMRLSPVPLKTRRVGQRCTLNMSRAETSSRWCGS